MWTQVFKEGSPTGVRSPVPASGVCKVFARVMSGSRTVKQTFPFLPATLLLLTRGYKERNMSGKRALVLGGLAELKRLRRMCSASLARSCGQGTRAPWAPVLHRNLRNELEYRIAARHWNVIHIGLGRGQLLTFESKSPLPRCLRREA